MATRGLKDRTYVNGIPAFGLCSKCERPFTTTPEARTDPEKAIRDFYALFESHDCNEGAGQAAAQIVKGTTKGPS
jgi:hypothetical protein